MFYSVEEYPFLQEIIAKREVINQEFQNAMKDKFLYGVVNATDEEFLHHYTNYWARDNGFSKEQIGYDIREGHYHTLPLFKKDFPVKYFDVVAFFPETSKIIQKIPNLHFSGFFKMFGKSKLGMHTHNRRHLIFHILLNDLEDGDCVITVNGETKALRNKGDHMLFDYSYEHGTENFSSTPRLNFIVDFDPF